MNRLQSYRYIEGKTQQDLGEMLGVSAALISAVESGRRPLTFDVSQTGYTEARFALPTMSEPLHRQRAATRVASTRRAKELLRVAGELFIELRNRNPHVPRPTLPRWPTPATFDEIENLTIDTRLELAQEETGPIKNLTSAAERAGICLIPIVGLEGIDGISAWVDDQPVIGLSPNVPGDRFRFSLAHEIAHLAFHRTKGETSEAQANRFAGALLIGRDDFDAAVTQTSIRDFINLKATWGVAVGALVYRAHELGYIDDRRYRTLQIQMSRWRRSEPGSFPPRPGQLLPRLIETAGGVRQVAEALGMNPLHVAEVADWRPMRAA